MLNKVAELQSIKKIVMIISFVIIVVFSVIIFINQYKLIQDNIERDLIVRNEYIHNNFNLFLNELKTDTTVKTNILFRNKEIIKAFNDKDRELLYSLIKENYEKWIAQNPFLKIMTFRLTDGSTFLRVHKPKMYGDKLNKKRKIILDTIKTQKRQYGFEVGKLKMTYRVVTPIFYNKKFIGLVEVGIEPEFITKKIDAIFNNKTALLIKTDSKNILLEQKKMEQQGEWVLARGDDIFLQHFHDINLKDEHIHIKYNNEIFHVDTNLNLYNNHGKAASKLLMAFSVQEYINDHEFLLRRNVLIMILPCLILGFLLHYGFNFYIRKIEKAQKDLALQNGELEKQNIELEEAQTISKLGSWSLDLVTNELKWSNEIYKIFEIDQDKFEASYDAFLAAIHPDDKKMVAEAYNNSLLTKNQYEIEHRLLMSDGRVKWVKEQCDTRFDETGKALMSIGTVQDITEQKNLSVQLKELNRDLEKKVEERTKKISKLSMQREKYLNTIQSILVAIDDKGVITLINPAGAKLLGYEESELIGKSWFDTCLPKDEEKDEVYAFFKQIISGVEEGFEYHENHIKAKDGTLLYIAWQNAYLTDEENNIIGVLSSGMDITAQKMTEEALIEAKTKAEEATKTKSYFLANMSHEIRTPMNGILGMSHLALKTNLDDRQRNYINKIHSSANTLLSIINDILDLSKIEAGKLKIEKVNFDLFKVIENVINLVEVKAYEKNLEVTVDYYPDVGKEFYGDSLRINQILTNLLSNAVKFTAEGEIGLVVKKVNDENKVRFEVRDTGIGLSSEQIEKVFESFTQADGSTTKKFGGTGLGLSITKQLVELMNGKIWIESELGMGSSFICEIELQKQDKVKPFTMFNGKKALIIDDNQSWLDILEHIMNTFGLNVDCVHSGKNGIERLRKDPEKYDLILVDWNMPELDGIETCKVIKDELNIDCKKIILISAYKEESLIDGIREAKIDRYLHKPVNPSVLNDILGEIFLGQYNNKKIQQMKEKNNLHKEIKTLKGSKILLVEDNVVNQEIIFDLLEESGIQIDVAFNGFEAIKKFENNCYELILMDIQMPILDGYEATKEIRKVDKNIPIVALTANAMKDDIVKTQNAGMNEHLNKPIDVEKLYETLLEFIPKKDNLTDDYISIMNNCNKNIEVPDFDTLDKEYALKLILGNKSAFIKILKGLTKYKEIKFDELIDEDFYRTIHSLKGLCASAGALELSNLAKELEVSSSKELLPSFSKKLLEVIDEVETKLPDNKTDSEKLEITKEKRDELFEKLKDAVLTKRAKNCKPIIEELEGYMLEKDDEKLFKDIKALTDKFKFKQALELF